MEKKDFVLAILAASEGSQYSPVQVQKLFFLIDKKISKSVNGPHFKFQPYDYGPFDPEVYKVLKNLSEEGDVDIRRNLGVRKYKLTIQGQKKGLKILNGFNNEIKSYIKKLSDWVISVSFAELVSSIYKEYPAMKKHSVFKGS